jgi:hypothetical protein
MADDGNTPRAADRRWRHRVLAEAGVAGTLGAMRPSTVPSLFGSAVLLAAIAFTMGVGYGRRGADVAELWQARSDLAADVEAYDHRDATEARLGIRVARALAPVADLTPAGVYAGRPAGRTPFLGLLPALLTELDRYPPAVVKRIGLHRVLICTDLTAAGRVVGGTSDFSTGTLYLSTADADGGPAMFRHIVHHELFHLIDYAAGTLGRPDPAWTAANPAGFQYGGGGFDALTQNASVDLASATTGFLTSYSRSAIEEDKAEVYGWLMADPGAASERAAVDPTVQVKLARLREILTGFDPELGRALLAGRQ